MAEILFVTWDGGGNVPPAVGIAQELPARAATASGSSGTLAARGPGRGRVRGRTDAARPALLAARRQLTARPRRRRSATAGSAATCRRARRPARRPGGRRLHALRCDGRRSARGDAVRRRWSTSTTPTSAAAGCGADGPRHAARAAAPAPVARGAGLTAGRQPAGARPGRRGAPGRTWRTWARWSPSRPRGRGPDGAGEPQHFGFPRMPSAAGVLDATAPASCPGRRHDRPGRRPGRPSTCRPTHEVHRFVPHAELMPPSPSWSGTAATHDDAGAGPRPAGRCDADAPDARPADGRASRWSGRAPGGWCRRRRRSMICARSSPGCWPTARTVRRRPGSARAIRAMPGATNGADRIEALLREPSFGARSPLGSTVTSSRPSQPASRGSSAASSSAVSAGRPARRRPPSRRAGPTAGRP